ncbi:MAG TPA: helical backbone metal receptor [Gemmatimonadales bacterium]|nr:helical backbone metal receptor [Gemmatimonadales bacterium]
MADDGGDTVRVGVPARRIVSLVPAITEMLFAIGAGDAVVGRTTWCDYPAAALKVPSVGDGIDPNLEAVVARRPDLVLLYSSGQNVAAHERLADLGVPSLRLTTDHLADVPRLARLLGRVTGHELQGDSVARAFEAALAETSAPPGVHPLSVFFLAWTQPAMTVGRGSFLTELLARAGARNVFDDVAPSSAVVSIEAVAARNPDLILTLGADAPSLEGRPEWSAVGAVREGRLVHIEGTEFSWPGPRSPDAIRELRSALGNARAAHAATLSAEVGE